MNKNHFFQLLLLPGLALTLAGCKAPSVNLSTNEPIKVDINVRLDVYQHGGSSSTNGVKREAPAQPTAATAQDRRRIRMAEIQEYKNSRLIGEGRNGLLLIRSRPPGDFGEALRRAVEAENRDRMEEMKEMAEKQQVSLEEIQKKQAEIWRTTSFKGEWIEIPQPDGTFLWAQKEG